MSVTLLAALFIATVARSSWAMGDVKGDIEPVATPTLTDTPTSGIGDLNVPAAIEAAPCLDELQPAETINVGAAVTMVATDEKSPISPDAPSGTVIDPSLLSQLVKYLKGTPSWFDSYEIPDANNLPVGHAISLTTEPGQDNYKELRFELNRWIKAGVPCMIDIMIDSDSGEILKAQLNEDSSKLTKEQAAQIVAAEMKEWLKKIALGSNQAVPIQATHSVITPEEIERVKALLPQKNFDGSSPQTANVTSAITSNTTDENIVPSDATKLERENALIRIRTYYAHEILAVPGVWGLKLGIDSADGNSILNVYFDQKSNLQELKAMVLSIPRLKKYADAIRFVPDIHP